MKFLICVWVLVVLFVLFIFIGESASKKKEAAAKKKTVSPKDLGEIIASLAFVRSDEFIKKELRSQTTVSFMLPERIQYYSELMYTCMMINSLNTLPESVDLSDVATAAVIHIQANNLSFLTYLGSKNGTDASEQIISDYHNMFDQVYDALQIESSFILGGIYRDYVIQDADLFNKLNENLKVTTMVSSWLSDASMLMDQYTVC